MSRTSLGRVLMETGKSYEWGRHLHLALRKGKLGMAKGRRKIGERP